MEVSKLNSNVSNLREELMACSFVEAVAVQTLLAAQKSLACLLIESLLNNVDGVPNSTEKRFPLNELRRREKPGPENKDGSDTEDDDEDDGDEQVDDDDDDEDLSGEEEGGDDEEEGDPKDNPEANGNDGSDDDDDDEDEDEDGDDGDEDEDGEDNEDEEEEEEEEEDQPPAKKKK